MLANGTDQKDRPSVRVLIVDDNPHVRRELRTLLPLAGDIEIAGEAADGQEAVRLAQALRPQVVLMDLEMPVLDGYAAARQIRACCPGCQVVALTVHDYEAARRRAADAGMELLIVKGSPLEHLVAVLLDAIP
ncbi:MAG TPA: response regulator transcription factor [Anaerolineae bacterium]|nr:response regulator transcription factor [Anaerolineae bacterium]